MAPIHVREILFLGESGGWTAVDSVDVATALYLGNYSALLIEIHINTYTCHIYI